MKSKKRKRVFKQCSKKVTSRSKFVSSIMAGALDKALLEMSLEEDDEPYVLPDRPEYYSTERNSMSLIGRLLNPQCKKMSDLILEMPRKWQLYDRVKGVALSKEKFQFIFKYERDLIDVLNRGPHTSNM